ncbi:RidA family protein [Candidatus Poribacteria bacterium]|nr:RidA family protein [Candidatus Poribacteria bacterium]
MKEIIPTTKAPAPVGPYSPVVAFGDLIFVSGQGPLDPKTSLLVSGTVEEETRQTLENIKNILEDVGSSLDNVLKVNAYLGDMEDFFRFNEVYKEYFPSSPPARTCIQAGRLPFDIMVEIEVIACRRKAR